MRKIFFIGLHKTGTSTISTVFEQLGYRSIHHWRDWIDGSDRAMLREFDVFADGCLHDFRKLHQLYPDAYFVLNVRPLKPWIISKMRHIDELRERRPYLLPSDLDSCGGMDPNSYSEGSIKHWADGRRSYHRDAIQFFQGLGKPLTIFQMADLPKDALNQNFRDLFLALNVPDEKAARALENIPHVNKNDFKVTQRQKFLWDSYCAACNIDEEAGHSLDV